MREGVTAEGFLLFDAVMNPVFVNHAAAEILLYPEKVETQIRLDSTVTGEILWFTSAGQQVSFRKKSLSVPSPSGERHSRRHFSIIARGISGARFFGINSTDSGCRKA
jgi:hypothetical protein